VTASVRFIRETDADAFRAVLDAVASERKYLATIKAPPLERVREFIRDNVSNNHAQYVAEVDGRLVGWADALPAGRDSTRHMASVGMGIIAGFRGQGIGRRLLEAVIEHCWRAGLMRIELEVFVDNAPAIALYEKLGFQYEGRLRKARLIDGDYKDVFHMALLHPSIAGSGEN
jgi:RimJ/RimL family protein N-acetyltransferase